MQRRNSDGGEGKRLGRQPSVLRDAAFLRLWLAATASGLAAWAMPFILGFAVVDDTITPTELGVVLAARTAGFLAAIPVAGVLADRYTRRTVVFVAALAAAIATPLIAAGLGRSTWIMAAAAVVVGAGAGASRPAFQAFTAEVVDPSLRQKANAAIMVTIEGAALVTPGLAALLLTIVGVEVLVIGTGLLWFVAASAPPSSRRAPTAGRSVNSFVGELAEGIGEARRHPWYLPSLAALTAVIATGYSATAIALPLISRDRYGSDAVLASAITAFAAGALVGALLVARWRPRSQGWVALTGLACYGFAPLSLLLPVPSAVVIAGYVLTGMGLSVFDIPFWTATQHEVEPHLLARVSSLDFLLAHGFAPVGLALIGPAIDAFGIQTVLVVCATTCFLAPAVATRAPGTRYFSQPTLITDPPRKNERITASQNDGTSQV